MESSALSAALRGDTLSDLLAALRELPDAHALDDEDVQGFLRVFYVELSGFSDLIAAARVALDVYLANKATLPMDELRGSVRYLIGLRDCRLDRTGYPYLASSPNLAVSLELGRVATLLRERDPDGAEVLQALSTTLRKVEGAHHVVYQRLRAIGDRHVDAIEWSMGAMTPSLADMVLHALDGFVGNEAVAALYDRMIDRLPADHALRRDFATYLARVRPG